MLITNNIKFVLLSLLPLLLLLLFTLPAYAPSDDAAEVSIEVASKIEYSEVPVIISFENSTKSLSEISSLQANEFKKENTYSTISAISGKITKKGLRKLMDNPDIIVEYDWPAHITLQDSLGVINATRTHSNPGITGKGETVCIIDTGINYTHPDLGGCTQTQFLAGNCSKVLAGFNYCANEDCSLTSNDPMDNNGHGTHVAGIVAANGSIRGVSPDSKIVAIKVFNSVGTGVFSDITAGIDWCVNNATKYNISVISMSLGTLSVFSNYCDSSFTSTTNAVNNAVGKGISVIAATGNDYNKQSISSPACIYNVTSVGSTSKSDIISDFSNSNSITDLLAPGGSINSTSMSGYTILSGTSMATPHVAGAFALLRQYKRSDNNTNLTPVQMQIIFNATGKVVQDVNNSLNFSRIDVFKAIKFVDTIKPSIFIQMSNNSILTTINISLNYTVFDNTEIDRCILTNVTGQNISLSGCTNTTILGKEGQNNITLYANDTSGNVNSSQIFFTVDTITSPILNFIFPTPSNNSFLNTSVIINVSHTEPNPDKIELFVNGSLNQIRNYSGTYTNFTIVLGDGIHNFSVRSNDTLGNVNLTDVRFITIDKINPNLSFLSPTNNSFLRSILVNISHIETNSDKMQIFLDGLLNETRNYTGTYTNFTVFLGDGHHNITAVVNDSAGNADTKKISLVVDNLLPIIGLQQPVNKNYSINIPLNWIASDINLDKVFFNLDNTQNQTITTNVTFNATEGSHILNIFANDSAGNINSSSISFNVDLTLPEIFISDPKNNSKINKTSVDVNYTVKDSSLESCTLEWKNQTLQTTNISTCQNLTLNMIDGIHTIKINANDTAGNQNSSSIILSIDTTIPILKSISPLNNSFLSSSNITINYTLQDNEIDKCSIVNTTGQKTLISLCANLTILGIDNQLNNITLIVNDTAGNLNSTQIFFTVDTIVPQLSTSSLPLVLNISRPIFNLTSNELLISATLELNGTNETLEGSNSTWFKQRKLADGNYTFKIYAVDLAGNINATESRSIIINATRNFTSYFDALSATINATVNATIELFNFTGGIHNFSNVILDDNYTLRFNINSTLVNISFIWINANTSNVVNVTKNITTNVSAVFNSSGGFLEDLVWVDINDFLLAGNYSPSVTFSKVHRIFFVLNGTKNAHNSIRIAKCTVNITSRPCFTLSNESSFIYMNTFSGVAAGNDTQSPQVAIQSPQEMSEFTSSIPLQFTVSDNVDIDSCWYSLNSNVNITIPSCSNITISTSLGTNTLRLSANDTSGNIETKSVNFLFSQGAGGGGTSTSSSSSGGSSSSALPTTIKPQACQENWKCQEWGECKDSKQNRTCNDLNSCNSTLQKPILEQKCQCELGINPVLSMNPETKECREFSTPCDVYPGWNNVNECPVEIQGQDISKLPEQIPILEEPIVEDKKNITQYTEASTIRPDDILTDILIVSSMISIAVIYYYYHYKNLRNPSKHLRKRNTPKNSSIIIKK